MKQYDLETVIRRVGLGSGKWDEIQKILGYTPEDVIPFSVADMEFVLAPEISEGLQNYLKNCVLGYAQPTEEYKEAVKGWLSRRHGWRQTGSVILRVSSTHSSPQSRHLPKREKESC